jgi:hypothetical protein
MADKYLNYTGLQYYHNRIKTEFADKSEIPTKLSELQNDGDGTQGSAYATEDYVDQNGGKIDSISVNGTAQTIDQNKNVDLAVASMTKSSNTYTIAQGNNSLAIEVDSTQGSEAVSIGGLDVALADEIPTATSDLTNDSGFITNAVNDLVNYYLKSETYTQAEVDNLIGQISTVSFEIVQSLPQTGQSNIIYLLANSGTTPNVYDEYVWINNAWEKIGSTAIDLSNYWTSTSGESNSLIAITTAEIDTIVGA